MNLSKYTVITPGDSGETLLYNTASGSFAAIPGNDLSRYEAELADAGFTTELSPEEELSYQRILFGESRRDASELALSIIPTYACNYHCPYCYEADKSKPQGKMSAKTIDRVMFFVERIYTERPFERMSVQWYGGDPSLALDVVEELSMRLITWCAEHDIYYSAFMLTNANLIGDKEAQLIADCRVDTIMLTIDGPEEIHNKRRVAVDGSNSYKKNIEAARHLRNAGVHVFATMNSDRNTLPLYEDLRDKLMREEDISLTLGKLNDYECTYGTGCFKKPEFDLMTHEEFFEHQAKMFLSEGHISAEYRDRLAPYAKFCNGQMDNYFVIDLQGDVYSCDGWVGDPTRASFNIFDSPDTWKLAEVSHDATHDAQCSACQMLPLCQGSCDWEREMCGKSEGVKPCHPLKTTLPTYLKAWRSCYDGPIEGFTRFA